MTNLHYLNRLLDYLNTIDSEVGANIRLTGQRFFNTKPVYDSESPKKLIGVNVTNLGVSPFIPLSVFVNTIELLLVNANRIAVKGNAKSGISGDELLPLDSIEGYVAQKVYGKAKGTSVLRRITPISRILEAAGIVENGRGYLRLIVWSKPKNL
jgi:hypothetical protein